MMRLLRPPRQGHICDLGQKDFEHQKLISPYASSWERLRHKFRIWATINRHSYKCRQYFRSNASIELERRRHMQNPAHAHVIHPFSTFVKYRQIWMFVLWLILFTIDPLSAGFMQDIYVSNYDYTTVKSWGVLLNMFLVPEILMNFITGYIIHQTREVVLNQRRIIKNYLTTYFVFDFVPCVAVITAYLGKNFSNSSRTLIRDCQMLRYIRMITVLETINNICEKLKLRESSRVILRLAIFILILLHWCTCLLATIPIIEYVYHERNYKTWTSMVFYHEKFTPIDKVNEISNTTYINFRNTSIGLAYIGHCAVVTTHFFGVGINGFASRDPLESMYLAAIMMLGLIFRVYVIARIIQIFGLVNFSETKYEELLAQATEYAVVKRFPRDLRNKITLYYEYKFDRKFFTEKLIMNTLTEHLRMEILLYSCRNLLERVLVFKGLSKAAIGCILTHLKHEIYLSGDVVINHTEHNEKIYFLLYGTCMAVIANSNTEMMHFEDGYHFGEMQPVMKSNGIDFNVIALEASDIYYIEKGDLRYCYHSFPEIKDRIQMGIAKKLRIYTDLAILRENDEYKTDEITMQLRRGRILQHGTLRSND